MGCSKQWHHRTVQVKTFFRYMKKKGKPRNKKDRKKSKPHASFSTNLLKLGRSQTLNLGWAPETFPCFSSSSYHFIVFSPVFHQLFLVFFLNWVLRATCPPGMAWLRHWLLRLILAEANKVLPQWLYK